jgi:ribosomal protein S18 acetylase RimI-like enzyme
LAYDAIDDVKTLFKEYAVAAKADLCFQDFDQELLTLPGSYDLPDGRLYIAYDGSASAGCVAMRPLSAETCKMKRLYVRPAFRRTGLGEMLARQIISDAAQVGYGRIVLDTLSSMTAAIDLYLKLGFSVVTPYYTNPLPGTVYMGLDIP